jgi:hypothetical protein
MDQLSDAHLQWASSFLSIHVDVLISGRPDATANGSGSTDGKLPSPMLPDCHTVHGKVPGPENHLLCTTHNHVVDVDAKTIIAHSLEEYMKAHPVHHNGHSGHAGHAPPKATPATNGAATPNAMPSANAKPPEVKPTPIPTFTGSGKEKFAQECALLDTLRPSKDNPEIYSATVNGKEASLAKGPAEALLANVTKQMGDTISLIMEFNDNVIKIYKGASAKGLEHIGSGLNKLVSFVKGDGWIHDPEDELEKLQNQWRMELSMARMDLAGRHFQAAALKTADGEIKGLQADHLVKVFESRVQKNASTTLSVLENVEAASKTIAKTIATMEFGPAGGRAIDTVFAGAEVAGEALAGHDIDWAGRVIDLGMNVLMDKFRGQAEAAVKQRVAALLEDKLKRLGKEKAKALAEKIAEKVAKKAVEKGSEFVKEELHAAANAMKGKKATYADLAKTAVDSMGKHGAANSKLESVIANDPEYAQLAAPHPA